MSNNKRSFFEQIEALLSQAKTVMSETTVPVDERIQRAADIYGQAESMASKSYIDDKNYELLLSDSAKFFYDYGMYKEALSRYIHLITLRETIYGQDHSITAAAYHDIGEVYRNLCDYPKALEYNIKALGIRKKFLGEKNLETAESYNDTALVFFYQGDYDKATELILKAKDIREEVVGENHPDTAESYANLGLFSLKQEDYAKGLENYSKALNIFESTLGREHRKTGVAFCGIGCAYCIQSNYSDALENYSKALVIYEKELGVNHPDTAVVYMSMGSIHNIIGGVTKALEFVTKSLDINEKMLGEENLNTALSYCALGWVKNNMEDYQEALGCFEKCLNITEQILGLEHPDTAEAYFNMGFIYYMTDDNIKAYEYLINAHQFYEKCARSEYIESKIKNVESYMDLIEVKPEEEAKGTRDLFLETLTKIGCQYEIDPDDDSICFGYQGENFVASATNEGWYVRVWDTYWGHVELYDIDEFSRLRKAVNNSNLNCATMTVYTINEERNTVDVHSKSVFPFMSQMPNLEDYLRNELGDFFNAHRLVSDEMVRLREQQDNAQAN